MTRVSDPARLAAALACVVTLTAVAPLRAEGATPKAKAARVVAARREVSKDPPPRPPPRVLSSSGGVDPRLKASLTEAINQPALDGAEFGLLAVRLKDGVVMGEVGADQLINPASNAKLITAAAALHTLHAEHRFKTEYFVNGTLKDGTLFGNLVVKGYGDPTIVSERLMRVANELYLFGIERITGGVIVDGSWFDGVDEARGWEIEEAPDRAYAAPITALAVNFNATSIYVRPTEPGKPAIVAIDPPSEQVVLEGSVMTEQLGSGVKVFSKKDESEDGKQVTLITVEGSVGARQSPFRNYRRVYAPLRHFGSTLVYFLQQRGVKVQHRVMEGPVPDGARLVLVDRSPPLTEILSDLNHYSNNIIAETLIKAIGAEVYGAPGSFENGLKVAHAFLEEQVGFAPGSYTFDNGSGLNDVNRFTPRQMVRLLTYMQHDVEGGTEYAASLAVAGTQGTIGFRMRDTPAERRLRAKTGTLRGVSALSGYVADPSGELVAFSALSQNIQDGVSGVWQVQNAIGAALASNGSYKAEPEAAEGEGEQVSDASSPAPKVEAAPGGAP